MLSQDLTKIFRQMNDPVINGLMESPAFREIMKNKGTITYLFRKRLLEYYKFTYRSRPKTEIRMVMERAEIAQERASDIYIRRVFNLHPLPPPDLAPFAGKTVLLASINDSVDLSPLVALLEEYGVSPFILDLSAADPDSACEDITRMTDGILPETCGMIFVPAPVGEIPGGNSETLFAGMVVQMKYLLGCAQALFPCMTQAKGFIPFFGVVTEGGMSADGKVNPFMASLHSQCNVLPLAYARHANIKVIDFLDLGDMNVEQLLAELSFFDGNMSVGYSDGNRYAYEWVNTPFDSIANRGENWEVSSNSVILAVGGGTGITAECLQTITEKTPCRVYLAGRTGISIEEKYRKFVGKLSGKALRKAIIEEAEQNGNRLRPGDLEDLYRRIEKASAITTTMEKLRKRGAEVFYVKCDFNDPASVDMLFETIRTKHGRLDAVLYGAGIDISKKLMQKDPQSFESVLKPKMLGTLNLLQNIQRFPQMRKIIFFSSFYAWNGMKGSMDYTAGNRFMGECDKLLLPGMNNLDITTVYWPPWAQVGMASSKYLGEYFQSYGLQPLEPARGRQIFKDIFSCNTPSAAVVTLNNQYNDAETVGLMRDDKVFAANRYLQQNKKHFPMVDRIIQIEPGKSIKTVKRFSLDNDLYLHDHVFDNEPIVPGVFGSEVMAETARLIFPDKHILAVENLRFGTPFRFKTGKPKYALAKATLSGKKEGKLYVSCSLAGVEIDNDGRIVAHEKNKFSGTYVMGDVDDYVKQNLEDTVKPVSGLTITMPAATCHEICRENLYHFGPRMLGTVQEIELSQKSCKTQNSFTTDLFRFYDKDVKFSTNPLAIDIGVQGLVQSYFHQFGVRVIPIKCDINWSKHSVGMRSFTSKAHTRFINMSKKHALLDVVLIDGNGVPAISLFAELYIRDRTKQSEILFNSLTDGKGYGSLKIRLQDASLSLFAADAEKIQKEEVMLPEHWLSELSELSRGTATSDWYASRLALRQAILSSPHNGRNILDVKNVNKVSNKYRYNKHNMGRRVDLSISHSNGWGLAGMVEGKKIGVDIETFVDVEDSFSHQFLNQEELRIVEEFSGKTTYTRAESHVIAFSNKEALYKAFEGVLDISRMELVELDMTGKALFEINGKNGRKTKATSYFYVFDRKVVSVCIYND